MIENWITGGMSYQGMQIIIDDVAMSESKQDWSKVRSPSRAIRRLRRGFSQNIVYRLTHRTEILNIDNRLIMHSEIFRLFKQKIAEQNK